MLLGQMQPSEIMRMDYTELRWWYGHIVANAEETKRQMEAAKNKK